MKVVIVEDQILFQEFLVMLISDKLGYQVSGVARDGEEALELAAAIRPNLLILDILIPKLSGIHVASQIRKKYPDCRILALSSEMDVKTVYQVHRLNLQGFVDKNAVSIEFLKEAVQQVVQGKRYYSASVKEVLRTIHEDPNAFQKILTKREQEILTLIGGGLSDREIGELLCLSESSAQSHRRNLCRKLNFHSTPELIRYAQESGFWKAAFRQMQLRDKYHLHD